MSSSSLDFAKTSHDDLLTGRSPWAALATGRTAPGPERTAMTGDVRADVAIIGGGITGALAAEHLTALGHGAVVIDREALGLGSTRASTAMLQWETDSTLTELTGLYGFETAADIYRRSRAAVAGLAELVAVHRLPCAFRPRPTLYTTAGDIGERQLNEEMALRQRAGLPGTVLPYTTLRREFGFDREAAILSPGTSDGLPLIGPVSGATNIYAAYGYGGNGITFSYLASRMIAAMIAGDRQAWFEDFALQHRPENRNRFSESTMRRFKELERTLCVHKDARRSRPGKARDSIVEIVLLPVLLGHPGADPVIERHDLQTFVTGFAPEFQAIPLALRAEDGTRN